MSTSTSHAKPTILLIPGSFALPAFYDSITAALTSHGYTIQALHYPSIGLSSAPQEAAPGSMYDDASFIASAVSQLADEGKDVLLLAHSYGGIPATESIKGLRKVERESLGKKGGVVGIAYMTALVPKLGVSAIKALEGVPEEQRIEFDIDEKGWMRHKSLSHSASICFSDLSPEEGLVWVEKFPCHSSISFAGELTYAGYKDLPVSWLLCEEDLCIPAEIQRESIEVIERESGRKVDVTSIAADHCPMAGKPQEVIDWVLDVLGKAEHRVV